MNEEAPLDEIIVPDIKEASYLPASVRERRKYSPGLLGLAERIPGVRNQQAASAVLFVVAVAAMLSAIVVLKGAFPVNPDYSTHPAVEVTPT